MKRIYLLLAVLSSSTLALSQTLYVPSGTNGIANSTNGNVGIGTSSPLGKLTINTSGTIGTPPNFSNSTLLLTNGSSNLGFDLNQIYFTDDLNLQTSNDLMAFYTNDTKRMVIKNSGKVAIGTESMLGQLTVYRNASMSTPPNFNNSTLLVTDGASKLGFDTNQISASADLHIQTSNNNLFFYTKDLIRMTINQNGAVGIGTATMPGNHKLYVDGSAVMEEVKVALSENWADFVFEKDYPLPPLEEVETHIKANGHLKDIPSEAEVKENGINLGEMDAKLLQKIEELMLYTIEQDKTLKEQQKIIEIQQKQFQLLQKQINELKNK